MNFSGVSMLFSCGLPIWDEYMYVSPVLSHGTVRMGTLKIHFCRGWIPKSEDSQSVAEENMSWGSSWLMTFSPEVRKITFTYSSLPHLVLKMCSWFSPYYLFHLLPLFLHCSVLAVYNYVTLCIPPRTLVTPFSETLVVDIVYKVH